MIHSITPQKILNGSPDLQNAVFPCKMIDNAAIRTIIFEEPSGPINFKIGPSQGVFGFFSFAGFSLVVSSAIIYKPHLLDFFLINA